MTERDHKLMEGLSTYGVLSTRQINELFFQGIRKTTVLRRLRLLERRKCIRRLQGLPDGARAWCLTSAQAERLGLAFAFGHSNRNTIEHDVLLNDVRVSLKRVGVGENWTPEHVLRRQAMAKQRHVAREDRVIPDGLLTARQGENKYQIAVELELHAKTRRRYRKLFFDYKWKRSLWAIWYIVPHESIGRLVADEWQKQNNGKHDTVIWSLLSDVLNDPWNVQVHVGPKIALLRGYIDLVNPDAHGGAHPQSSADSPAIDHAVPTAV